MSNAADPAEEAEAEAGLAGLGARRAAAAMAFMGWTGRGMAKRQPEAMLARPEKTRVAGTETARWRARAMKMGRRVPRSPKAPEISARGDVRKVCTLWWKLRLRREGREERILGGAFGRREKVVEGRDQEDWSGSVEALAG